MERSLNIDKKLTKQAYPLSHIEGGKSPAWERERREIKKKHWKTLKRCQWIPKGNSLFPNSKLSLREAIEFPHRFIGSKSWTEPPKDNKSPVRIVG